MRVTPSWRKAILTLHVITAVGWLGTDLVLITLGLTGIAGWRPEVAYPALGYLGQAVFVPLSLLVWLVGVVNALVTPWGLFRHWWVVVKLALTTVMLPLVWFALRPNLVAALDQGAQLADRTRLDLVIAPIVSTSVLVFATILSTYKPWGRRQSTVDGSGQTSSKRSKTTSRSSVNATPSS